MNRPVEDGNPDPNRGVFEVPHSNEIDQRDIDLEKAVTSGGSALERIRKNAADWRTGIAGLLTVVTTALVFKPPEKVSSYPLELQIILGAIALAAAVDGAVGLWLLLKAAHGDIEEITAEEVEKEGGYEGWMRAQTRAAADQLRRGRQLTAASAVLVGGLIGIAWFAPQSPDDPPAYVRVTEIGADTSQCGTLQVADAKGVTFKVKEERDPQTVPFDKLKSVALVDKC